MSERMPRGAAIVWVALISLLAAPALSSCTASGSGQATTAFVTPAPPFVTPAPPGSSEAGARDAVASDDPASHSAAESGATAADLAFMSAMVAHHEQAVELAELAPGRVEDPELAEFAGRILVVQAAEADTVSAWLDTRRSRGRANAEHEHEAMSGEISRSTFDRATTLDGAAFDDLFIAAMVPHHRGAVEMAEARLGERGEPAVTRWAREIATSQALEIDRLLEIEARLAGRGV
ncbi:DUF305 domain-containing protein [Agromyces sp. NPDC058484]|uniref:DUF305 domain-containing protein n=1 Tax=Agromyces sp. NPDC058484 TaxID=3346524 RepID=UPI00365C47CF